MNEMRILTEDLLEECQYDCVTEIRKIALETLEIKHRKQGSIEEN